MEKMLQLKGGNKNLYINCQKESAVNSTIDEELS